jgi:hypothetical protein
MAMRVQDVRTLFCERAHCAPSEYEERAFRECLYWHARIMAPVLRWLMPGFFLHDLNFVRYLGAATSLREINAELLSFREGNVSRPSFGRTTRKFRVSGRRAARLARRLFAEKGEVRLTVESW